MSDVGITPPGGHSEEPPSITVVSIIVGLISIALLIGAYAFYTPDQAGIELAKSFIICAIGCLGLVCAYGLFRMRRWALYLVKALSIALLGVTAITSPFIILLPALTLMLYAWIVLPWQFNAAAPQAGANTRSSGA